jgi:two-component system phosphate regulon sensor histidine kinase PhoR
MKNRIVWKFFGAFTVLTLIVVFVLNFFVALKLSDNFEQKISQELRSDAILVADLLQEDLHEGKYDQVRQKVSRLAEKLNLRITVVDTGGTVLGDSEEEPSLMENHSDRPEIVEALETGFGQSTRFSDTLGRNMKYVAIGAGPDGDTLGIVRFSLPLSQVQLEIRTIYRVVLFGALAAVAIALTVAYFVSRSITLPIRQMKETAEQIARGDFAPRVRIRGKDELGELADSLNTMADELQQKIEDLRRMDRVRTDFVANVSHELKTPLTLIKGYTETLQNEAIGDRDKAARFVSIIKEHADRLGNIVDDLLSLSELESSKEYIDKTRFDLKELADDVSLGFGHALTSRKQTLTVESQGEDFSINADRDKIEQVLVNLIDNAIKYTPQSGRIELSIIESDKEIRIVVRDYGIGIAKEHLARIFERFYRADKARSRELGGTGLGLSIAKHIVLAHDGKITIESELGKGTAVSVILPKE